ncbi:hypothetical protein AB3S75_004378 [Citrus x aurantiifolia]
MASKASPSASPNRSEPLKSSSLTKTENGTLTRKEILSVIDCLKNQVAADHFVSVQRRVEKNRQKLIGVTNHLYRLSLERRNNQTINTHGSVDLLTKRQREALGVQNGIDVSSGDRDSHISQEDGYASTAVYGSSNPTKNVIRPIKLNDNKRLPPYTTWIFLDRNQRMTEDQSVMSRRRIYYDQNGGEALICSDSEEEVIEEEEKKDFVDSEDYILRSPSEVKARYEILSKEESAVGGSNNGNDEQTMNNFLVKDLEAALDSFDNLFCRRCLVFDCRLHGCSQDLVFPAEKQPLWYHLDEGNVPCGPHCYRSVLKSERNATACSPLNGDIKEKFISSSDGAGAQTSSRKKFSGPARRVKSHQSESASSNAKNLSESSDSEVGPRQDTTFTHHSSPSKSKLVGKVGICKRKSKRVAERALVCKQKKQKKMAAFDLDSVASGGVLPSDMKLRSTSRKENEDANSSSHKYAKSSSSGKTRKKEMQIQDSRNLMHVRVPLGLSQEIVSNPPAISTNDSLRKDEFVAENMCKQELSDEKSWKTIEKGLFDKGVEIFGRNSCLIARNLLNGLKTCWEVFQYMTCSENKLFCQAGDAATSLLEGYSKFDFNGTTGNNEVRRRSRYLRRRGRVRRLKYTWKSAAYHSIRKRITERKDQPCRQYNPCGCQTACGKQCPCLLNGTCCEKYCGCPKSCKNRFRGCHCAKSQCRSRQCPCFAADRECDPDVCRNCWISCGDGSLGVPDQKGDNYECRNMKLLLKQQQRVLLGRSDVSGWGAFLKNSVGKHEYLGEYTGELISHREADKRGKIYDRENSSFLFNLNDQFVLDAYRKGDKLKFANHSPDPNCYAKVIMVAGDHRVGIFAKERISAGEELFYDYRYEPDRAPAWARKPEASGSKKEEGGPSSGRAKKLA